MPLGRNLKRSNTPTTSSNRAKAAEILVVLLHNPQERLAAERLALIWKPTVPAAVVSLLSVTMSDLEVARREVTARRAHARLSRRKVVLVGTRGTEALALALAYGSPRPLCGGLLICGSTLPMSTAPEVGSRHKTIKCRLVCNLGEAVSDDFLEQLLRRLRAAGVDAQGAILESMLDLSPASLQNPLTLSDYSASVIRMGGGYLAELVATALASGDDTLS
jgi:hypothetical protein